MRGEGILSDFRGEAIEQKLSKMMTSSNLRQGSVWIHKLCGMIDQEFKKAGSRNVDKLLSK